VLGNYLAGKYPESFDPSVPSDLVYSGSRSLTEAVSGTPLNVGQLILSPTRTYAPVIKAILGAMRAQIHGMVHCSGGAQTKVMHFVEGVHVIKDNLFPIPPLFDLIQKESGTSFQEMYKVFNMGHRMELYVAPEFAEEIIQISQSFGIPAQIVGHVEAAPTKKLTIKSTYGEFIYE
jgi:phosphoribosylformylglycinamidine cyclo-ligase